ncbi:MAG: rod shape-determining protein [Sphingomonadales bacterium]|nr:MAG: rod shape-determining protein [Sphingomonadales bacterium]
MFDNAPAWAHRKADFAIDLGTANTLVVERSAGVVFEQPSVCCFDDDVRAATSLYAAGTAAKRVVGREVKQLRTVRPLRNGVLVDVAATRELIRFAMKPVSARRRLSRARALIGVPSDATQAERRALTRAAFDAGLAEPRLVAEPILAAIGLGMDVAAARGRMIVDCGAGTTDVVVLSLGGICAARSVRGGGDGVEAALLHHLHLKRQFHIGPSSAESLKMALSEALASGAATHVEVRGLDIRSGLPRLLALNVDDLRPIVEKYADEVAAAVRAAFAQTDPDLATDILEDGIMLTGGAALTALVAERVEESTGLRVHRAEDPTKAVAKGLQSMLD